MSRFMIENQITDPQDLRHLTLKDTILMSRLLRIIGWCLSKIAKKCSSSECTEVIEDIYHQATLGSL